MAKYPAVITTMAGTNTIAEANASKQALIFTKIVIGAGDMPASIPRATALTDKRLELAITKSIKTGDGQFMVQGLLSNKNLEAGFYAREIGLMAKAGENGQEVLFSYTNGGNYVDYIPDKNTPMDSYTFTITTVVGNAEKVQAIVSDNGVASVHDLEAHNMDPGAHGGLLLNLKNQLSTHNTDISSHPAITDAIAKILGATNWRENPAATLKDIKNLLGMGGIVAQRLEENGFVKFANGFTIQWGYKTDNLSRYRQFAISLLLPYSSKYIPVVVPEYLGNPTYDENLDRSTAISRIDKTLTSFKACIDDRCTGLYWITVGS